MITPAIKICHLLSTKQVSHSCVDTKNNKTSTSGEKKSTQKTAATEMKRFCLLCRFKTVLLSAHRGDIKYGWMVLSGNREAKKDLKQHKRYGYQGGWSRLEPHLIELCWRWSASEENSVRERERTKKKRNWNNARKTLLSILSNLKNLSKGKHWDKAEEGGALLLYFQFVQRDEKNG